MFSTPDLPNLCFRVVKGLNTHADAGYKLSLAPCLTNLNTEFCADSTHCPFLMPQGPQLLPNHHLGLRPSLQDVILPPNPKRSLELPGSTCFPRRPNGFPIRYTPQVRR